MTKDGRVSLRIDSKQLAEIDKSAKAAGMSRSEYIGVCCTLNPIVKVDIDTQDLRSLYRQHAGIAGNLNQLMRRVNKYGLNESDSGELLEAARQAKASSDAVRDELREIMLLLRQAKAVGER